jgi:UDP-N-acetyl-2-amino-2-deoxyglucuronate dehydrogenase
MPRRAPEPMGPAGGPEERGVDRCGFVIIGAGNIAQAHVEAIAQLEDAYVVGVTSATPAKARRFAERYGVRAYGDLADALADDEVRAVSVCTPSGAHLQSAVAAAEAGRHVVVEKPLEVTSARARAIVEAADRAGVKLATIFMGRFSDAAQRLKAAIDAGRLGRLLQADADLKWYRSQAYYDSAAWRGTWALDGGGALINQGIHQLDLLLWLAGPVDEAFAYAGTLNHERLEVEDTLVAVLRYRSGALGTFTAATSLYPGRPKGLDVHGTEGSVGLRDDEIVTWEVGGSSEQEREALLRSTVGRVSGTFSDPMAMSFENHRRQLEDFVRAIGEDRPPLVDGREGLRSVELVEAIYRSVRERRPVSPGEA